MNIAVFSHYFTPEVSAPSMRVHDMARQWLAQRHPVQVVTCFPNHPTGVIYPGYAVRLHQHQKLDGIDVHRHWTYTAPNKGFAKKTLGHISYLPAALLLSAPRLAHTDVAIGSSPTLFAAMAAAAFAAKRRIPFVMEVRDLWPAIFVELGVLRNPHLIHWLERLELALYHRATGVVTVTDSFRQNIIGRGVAGEKVVTIPNGADVDYWQPQEVPTELRWRLGLEEAFVVLYIGTHGVSQALRRILDTASQLAGHTAIRFLFVGDGAEKPQLVEEAHRAGLDNVRFLDAVGKAEARALYALADVCLVPLRNIPLFETFIPSKMFEIMAMGRPIVASVAGEAAGILRRSDGAIVVPPEDSTAIGRAIVELQRDPERATSMGRRGREFVVQHYSRRMLANDYLGLMEAAISDFQARCK